MLEEMFRRILKTIGFGLAACLAALIVMLFWPLREKPPKVESRPIRDFTQAQEAAHQLTDEPESVKAECRSAFLDHGHRTKDVYVLLHGLSNCPAQYREFAKKLFDAGANVLIPRTPHHGLSDRMTGDLSKLTGDEMVEFASHAVDLAQGLGERVIVVGLSVNAVTAAWIAQERNDVALAVIIAPFFAPHGLPDRGIAPLSRLLLRLPNVFVWWDRQAKQDLLGSPFSYPRFSTRAIGQVMGLGMDVFKLASEKPPAARKILIVTAPADPAISVPRAKELAALWGKDHTQFVSFPAEWNVPHDCIDPDQPGGQIDKVYPFLTETIDGALR